MEGQENPTESGSLGPGLVRHGRTGISHITNMVVSEKTAVGDRPVEVESQSAAYLMTERHTAVNIALRLSETNKEWDLLAFCTVHDNASNINLAMELCELFPKDLGCTGHTLQLVIKAGLVLPDIVEAIGAARHVVVIFATQH